MSIASFSTRDTLEEPIVKPRARWWRGRRFIVEVFDGADDALEALEAVEGGIASQSALTSTAFQSLNWLTVLYEELAPAHRALPRLIIVTERNSGEVALILPLLVRRKRGLRVATFADLGASNYGAPILGPALLKKPRSIRRAWRGVCKSLGTVDMVRLENMPAEIGGIANPLLTRSGIVPSRRSAWIVHIPGTIDDYIDSRGRQHRDDLARCWMLWKKDASARFQRAATGEDVAHAYSVLVEQIAEPVAAARTKAHVKQTANNQFFERLAIDGSEVDLVHLFTMEAGGDTIATMFGVEHDGTFTILRLADAGGVAAKFSPSRLLTLEVMRYFVERGVRRFDLGRGDHPFKADFGADEVPLYDMIVARDLAAAPRAAFHRAKSRARKSPRLQAVVRRVSGLFSG